MSVTCPHCKTALDADPASGKPPATCPKCDGEIKMPDTNERSSPDPAIDRSKPAAPARRTAPGFLHRRRAQPLPRRVHWLTWGAVALLAIVLGLQLLLADRARLAADPGWRPTLIAVCNTLSCSLPPWREPSAFTMLHRAVRAHPEVPGALRISASFRNDARWPQAWPRLSLVLSDVDGHAVGARSFIADDYLDKAAQSRLIAPGQTATVVLDVHEPSRQVVAFTFDFR